VISLENIQLHRYALEPAGTVFLRWCLLFPSRFLVFLLAPLNLHLCRYADMRIKFVESRLLLNKIVSKIDLLVSAIVHDHGGSTGE
jgi:hypothetical protein